MEDEGVSMIEPVIPYLYQGSGVVLMSKRLSSGSPLGFVDIGRVSQATLFVESKVVEHRENRTSKNVRDFVVNLPNSVSIEMLIEHLNIDNLARFWGGLYKVIEVGTATEQLHVLAGYRYGLSHVSVSNVVVSALSGIPYIEGLDYNVDLETGGLQIITSKMEGLIIVTYTHQAQKKLEFASIPMEDYYLRFEGLNIAESKEPVVLECYKVNFSVLTPLRVHGASSSELKVKGLLTQDFTRPERNQFFQEIML